VGPRGLVNKKGTTVRVSLTHCLPLPPPPGEVVRVALPPPPVEWPAGWPVSFSTSTSRRSVPSPYSSPSSWCLPPVRRVTPAVGRWPPCSSRRRSPTATNPRVAGLDRDAVEGGWCSGRRCRHQRCGLWSASDCEKQRCSTASRNGPERQAVVEAWRVRRGWIDVGDDGRADLRTEVCRRPRALGGGLEIVADGWQVWTWCSHGTHLN
jgi:hypothetical protein